MELGAVVCTARAPRCAECPIATQCAWRASGYPAFSGVRRPTQRAFAGSDRQVRGLMLQAVRASATPVPAEALEGVWPDDAQRTRSLAGLLSDGLLVHSSAGYALP